MAEKESVGLDRKLTKRTLENLSKERRDILNEMKEKELAGVNPYGDGIPVSYVQAQDKLRDVERRIDLAREWYSLHVLEDLESSSKTLSGLTIILIGLTTALTIFTIFLILL